MLCTRGLSGCSRKSSFNQTMYEPTPSCTNILKPRNKGKSSKASQNKDNVISKPPKVPKSYHPNPDTPTMGCVASEKVRVPKKSKGMRSGRLAPSGRVGSGFIAMSPWKREVVRRSQQSLVMEEDKENSVWSHASSVISRTTSLSSVNTMVSSVSTRIGSLAIRGQLKLEISINVQGLTVNIAEAKNLRSPKNGDNSSFYAQVSLVPEDQRLSTFVTKVVTDGNCPTFNEKFTMQAGEQDRRKRILISIRQMKGTRSEIIGCTSFGVRHLLHKGKHVSGWFYLLNEELGRRKHLRVLTSSSHLFPGQDVRSLSTYEVDTPDVSLSERIVPGRSLVNLQETPEDRLNNHEMLHTRDIDTLLPPMGSQHGSYMSSTCPTHGHSNRELRTIHETENNAMQMPRDTDYTHQLMQNPLRPDPMNISRIPACGSDYEDTSRLSGLKYDNNKAQINFTGSDYLPSSFYDSTGEFTWNIEKTIDSTEFSWTSERMGENVDRTSVDGQSERGLMTVEQTCWDIVNELDRHENGDITMNQTEQSAMLDSTMEEDVSMSYATRWQHIDHLLSMEEEYTNKLHYGAQNYSRPLRHCVLTPSQHKTLFQNVEKLMVISQFHLKRLQDVCQQDGDDTLSEEAGMGAAYKPQLRLMCDAYTAYIAGLPSSLMLLDNLMNKQEFTAFLQNAQPAEGEIDILDFIKAPALHIEELMRYFDSVMLDMDVMSSEFDDVKQVTEAFHECIKGSSAGGSTMRCSADSGISRGSMGTRTMSQSSMSTVFSVDAEVAALQNKLIFPRSMKTFQVAAPNRHVIFSGDVYMVDGWKWVKVHLLLLSDLLLLTQTDTTGQIVAVREPIFLKDIIDLDFECFHHSEFVVTSTNVIRSGGNQSSSLVFRTGHVDEKSTWRHLLSQRVNTCRSQREFSL